MAVRGDEVAQKVEAHIREAIERMVADMRSTVADVREAIEQQLDAALQSVQADANAISLRSPLQSILSDLEIEPPAPPIERVSASSIRSAVQVVERGKNQVEILNALLEQALGFGSRAALLILKGDAFAGWKGVGFSRLGGNDEQVKRLNIAASSVAALETVLQQERVVELDGDAITSRIGVGAPTRAILIPMVIKDKVSAAVYVDAVEDERDRFDADALQLLVFTTGLLIDTLPIRKKIPSPSLSSGEESATQESRPSPAPAPPPPAVQPQEEPRPAPPPSPSPSPAAAPPSALNETVAVPAYSFEEPPPPARPARSFEFDITPPAAEPPPPPAPPAPPPAATPPPPAAAPEAGEKTSTQYIPPPGIGRGAAFAQPTSESAKKHDEARRFARLLVSEIKLYNEAKVEQGRKNRDLYERLKEDIDRSRQMYDERIPEDVRKASNYFYEELVRILADGDTDALGL